MIGKVAESVKDISKPEEKKRKYENEIEMETFKVKTDIRSRFASTVITSRTRNRSDKAKEITFSARLPESAFITDFCMQIGDKLVHGEVQEKAAAKETYEWGKAQGQTAGHVFQKARQTDVFAISTNVGANTDVTFTLTYQEILQRVHGVYKHIINLDLDQAKPTCGVDIEVNVVERGKVIKVHAPKVGPKLGEKANSDLMNMEIEPNCIVTPKFDHSVSSYNVIYRISPEHATGSELKKSQFVLLYDVERDCTGGQIQIVNGYFLHFFAPEGLIAGAKNVVFVLDKSSSMYGQKFRQTQDAMKRVLGDLRKMDYFNLVWFSDDVVTWKEKSVQASTDNVLKAISDVEKIGTEGMTNVHDAIMEGLELLSQTEAPSLASMIIFLTDGQANVGPVQQADELVKVITQKNETTKFEIHTLAFGNDADYNMLQSIAAQNCGLACKIFEDLDADVQLRGFYQQLSSPFLANVKLEYVRGAVDLDSLVYDHIPTYYDGSEMMILGRLKDLNINEMSSTTNPEMEIEAEISGRSSNGLLRLVSKCCWPFGSPSEEPILTTTGLTTKCDSDAGDFVHRMWAYQTIKKLLKESKQSFRSDQEKEAKRRDALALSLKYRFVTELTSMVVLEDHLKRITDVDQHGMPSYAGNNVRFCASVSACFQQSGQCGASYHQSIFQPQLAMLAALSSQSSFGGGSPQHRSHPIADTQRGILINQQTPMASSCSTTSVGLSWPVSPCSLPISIGSLKTSNSKPVLYLIVVLRPLTPITGHYESMEDWKTLLITFFSGIMRAQPAQQFSMQLIAVDTENGRACEVITMDNTTDDFESKLEGAVKSVLMDENIMKENSPIEDVVKRENKADARKQIWVNVNDVNITSGQLADVFEYLNKEAGYDYVSRDELNEGN